MLARRFVASGPKVFLADTKGPESLPCERIRECGWPFRPGTNGVSAPILNWQGEIEAAITLATADARVLDPRTTDSGRSHKVVKLELFGRRGYLNGSRQRLVFSLLQELTGF